MESKRFGEKVLETAEDKEARLTTQSSGRAAEACQAEDSTKSSKKIPINNLRRRKSFASESSELCRLQKAMRSSIDAVRPFEFVLFEIDDSATDLSYSSIFSLIVMGFVFIFSLYLVSFAFLRIEEIENSIESNDSSERYDLIVD